MKLGKVGLELGLPRKEDMQQVVGTKDHESMNTSCCFNIVFEHSILEEKITSSFKLTSCMSEGFPPTAQPAGAHWPWHAQL